MAKKKKRSHRKAVAPTEPNMFWRQAVALLLFVAAFLLLFGGFSAGGPVPTKSFNALYDAFGWAAYLSPVALIFYGIVKFSDEEHKIPFTKLVAMFLMLVFISSWLYVGFVSRDNNGVYSGGYGGYIGSGSGNFALKAIDSFPASILFLVLALLATFFCFGISLKILTKLGRLFKRPNKNSDVDLESLRGKVDRNFKLNEGVPVEHNGMGRLSLKNSVKPISKDESHQALTTANDPDWQFPGLELLNQKQDKADPGNVEGNANIIKDTLANFNINVDMEGANIGPRVTQFTLKPPNGVKLSKITALDRDLALPLAAQSIRIEAPIPGKSAVGIEVPNVKSATVRISSVMQSKDWAEVRGPLGIVVGKDIAGQPIVSSLDNMPHLLIAGQTGSGKSIMINSILTSLLYRNSPSDLKLILVDPKQVELTPYNDIPHLLTPVITEPEKCISALKWAVAEMERRLRAMADVKKRNIAEYNDFKKEEGMPYIVIIIDELADLMMMAARDVEALVVRLAQKARATGIHLVVATQRPSVDVITGLIKANVPARMAFTVNSQVDSRTIIDQAGAEKLLGKGDMLFLTTEMSKPKRIQGSFISDQEILKINDFIRMQRPPQYDDEVISLPVQLNGRGGIVADYGATGADDDMLRDAVHVVLENRKASTSLLQRRLRIGYGRAARIIETMEEQGIVGPADGSRPREVLISSMDDAFGRPAEPADVYDETPDEN